MKKMKKIFGLLLSMIMVLGMSANVFAAETGTITIDNPKDGATYKAYKIFDVTYNEDKTSYRYTLDKSSEWDSLVFAYAATSNNGIKLEDVPGDQNTRNVIITDLFSPAKFASKMNNVASSIKNYTTFTMADGKAVASGLELGYYLVSTDSGALCNLTTTTPDSVIYDKNDMPFTKVADDHNVELGQVVNFEISAKVPSTTGFKAYTYQITDTMSDGLTFDKNVKVRVDGAELDNAYYTLEQAEQGFVLSVDVMKMQDKAAKSLTVEYSATVNENAAGHIENNHAILTYSNDPQNTESKTTVPVEEKIYSAKIVVDKYETGNESNKLKDAKFILYKQGIRDAKLYYKLENQKVTWVTEEAEATVFTTDENGAVEFCGLENATYYLVEKEAPKGYYKLESPVEIVIKGNDTDETTLQAEADVENNGGTKLPDTGSVGTTIFYVMGAASLVVAFLAAKMKRRMR